MAFVVVLKSLRVQNERIILDIGSTRELAEECRKRWRRVLGGKHWTIDRRPGADTLDHLILTVEQDK